MATLRTQITAQIFAQKLMSGQKAVLSEIMVEAGYSPSYAHTCNLNKSKQWGVLVEKALKEHTLLKLHQNLLTAQKIEKIQVPSSMNGDDIKDFISGASFELLHINIMPSGEKLAFYRSPNYLVIDKALEKAYKIKQKYSFDRSGWITRPLGKISDEELERAVEKARAMINRGQSK